MASPVVVVVATYGDRLSLLTERALPSIAEQTSKADLVIVVDDSKPLGHLVEEGDTSRCLIEEEDIKRCFDNDYQNNVRLITNSRTQGNSGTGPWNTGMY